MKALVFLAPLVLSGCLAWQAGYDNYARKQCAENPNDADLRACLDRANENAREQRERQRGSGGSGK
jgi:hypothetical protein